MNKIKLIKSDMQQSLRRWQGGGATLGTLTAKIRGWHKDLGNVSARAVSQHLYKAIQTLETAIQDPQTDPAAMRRVMVRATEECIQTLDEGLAEETLVNEATYTPTHQIASLQAMAGRGIASRMTAHPLTDEVKTIRRFVGGFKQAPDQVGQRDVEEAVSDLIEISNGAESGHPIEQAAMQAADALRRANMSRANRTHVVKWLVKAEEALAQLDQAALVEHDPYNTTVPATGEALTEAVAMVEGLRGKMYTYPHFGARAFLSDAVRSARVLYASCKQMDNIDAQRAAERLYDNLRAAYDAAISDPAGETPAGWYIPEVNASFNQALSSMGDVEERLRQ